MEMSQRMAQKLGEVISRSVQGLDPADVADRIAWCRRTGVLGVHIVPEGENMLRLDWGGRTLAGIERSLLTDDSAELPEPIRVPEVPDDPRELCE